MDVVSHCPMVAMGFVWQSRTGGHAQTVVVKATFVLEPRLSTLAAEQDAPHDQDEFVKDNPSSILLVPSDQVPYKPRADVTVIGHAHAPNKQTARSLVARIEVGELSKSIEVHCDRAIRLSSDRLIEGAPFSKMRLDWSKAAGGPNTTNPAGMSFDAAPDAYGLVPIPNLQPCKTFFANGSDTFAPIGFGPIAPSWPTRRKLIDQVEQQFHQAGWQERPMPDSFDFSFFQTAPEDQQIAFLRPDERIVLENLHPVHSRLETRLPGLTPRAVVQRASGEREEVTLVADTLWIDTDRGICCMVWRGNIGLRHAREAGSISVLMDEPSVETLDDDLVVTIPPGLVHESDLAVMTMTAPFDAKPRVPAMPFIGAENIERPPVAMQPNHDGSLPFGASGVSRLPPGPIGMGQITLPAHDSRTDDESSPIPTTAPSELLQWLWHDSDSLARLQRSAANNAIVQDTNLARNDIFEVLAKAPRANGRDIDDALVGAMRSGGRYVPPFVVLDGELELSFDELEGLKAAMTAALPVMTAADEQLKAAIALAKEFLQTPGLSAAPEVSNAISLRIRDAFLREKKSMPSDYIETQMQRALLLGRHYQKREVFGGTFVRSELWLDGESACIVGYLPAEASTELPMWKRLRVRLIAEVHLAQDQYEWSPRAIKVVAVGRWSVAIGQAASHVSTSDNKTYLR